MRRVQSIIDLNQIRHVTSMQTESAQKHIKKSLEYLADMDKKKRLKECICRFCYYIYNERIAGQAFTNRMCGICDKDITYSSTDTDALCHDCSKKHELCRHCGADLKDRMRNKFELTNGTKR